MLTYNQIITISRAFQQAHQVLKNFGNGQEADMVLHNQQATYKYPLMWMIDLPSSQQEGIESFNFRVVFMAQVVTLKDRDTDLMSTNVNEVKSDMMQCANHFLAYWMNQTDNYDTLGLEKSVNRESFEDYTDDKLAGCSIDIRFYQPFDYNECIIPMGTPTALPDTCSPVLIYEDGILVDTVASGGTYSYVSGGGVASQTYNGGAVTDQVAGTTKVITVKDSASANVGTKGTDTALALAISIADSTVNITDSAAALLYAKTVVAEGTASQIISDSTVNVKDSAGNILYAKAVKAQATADQVVTDVTQTLNAVAITNNKAQTSKAITIRYANNDPVVVTTITDTEASFIGEVPDVVVPINVATTYKDGQTTSYLTGDAGANEIGEGTSFLVMAHNNLFGNTNRFTDELGGQTYTKNYICDWSVYNQVTGRVRVWYRVPTSAVISTALAGQPYTLSGISGWYIPNIKQLFDWLQMESAATMSNFAPFNINANSLANSLIVTNTVSAVLTFRYANSAILVSVAPSNTCRYIVYRDCTYAELATL